MKSRLVSFLCKFIPIICSLVITISTLVSNNCPKYFYQEKEPKGLAEFTRNIKNPTRRKDGNHYEKI